MEDILDRKGEILEDVWSMTEIGLSLVSEEGKFIKVNDYFCKMLGYEENQLINMEVSNVCPKSSYLMYNVERTDDIFQKNRVIFVTKDKEEILVLLTTCQVDIDGNHNILIFFNQVELVKSNKRLDFIKGLTLALERNCGTVEFLAIVGMILWLISTIFSYTMGFESIEREFLSNEGILFIGFIIMGLISYGHYIFFGKKSSEILALFSCIGFYGWIGGKLIELGSFSIFSLPLLISAFLILTLLKKAD